MIQSILKPKILGVIATVFVAGILFGTNSMNASAESKVPDWVKSTAGWWADDLVPTEEYLKGLEWMIGNGIIKVPSMAQDAQAQSIEDELSDIQSRVNSLETFVMQQALDQKAADLEIKFYTKGGLVENLPSGVQQDISTGASCDPGDALVGSFFQSDFAGSQTEESVDLYHTSVSGKQELKYTMKKGLEGTAYSLVIVCADINENDELMPGFKQHEQRPINSEKKKQLENLQTLFWPMWEDWDALNDRVDALEGEVFAEEEADVPVIIPLP